MCNVYMDNECKVVAIMKDHVMLFMFLIIVDVILVHVESAEAK